MVSRWDPVAWEVGVGVWWDGRWEKGLPHQARDRGLCLIDWWR